MRHETDGRRIMFIGHQNVDEFSWGRLVFQVLSDYCVKIEVAQTSDALPVFTFINTR